MENWNGYGGYGCFFVDKMDSSGETPAQNSGFSWQCHNLEVPMLILRGTNIWPGQEVELIQSCDGRFWQGSHPDGCPRKLLEIIKNKHDRRKMSSFRTQSICKWRFSVSKQRHFRAIQHQHAGCITLLSNSAVRLVILVSTSLSRVA